MAKKTTFSIFQTSPRVPIYCKRTWKSVKTGFFSKTAGFGLEAEKNPEWRKQFLGIVAERFTVTKNGAVAEGEIDALSGATVTSRAVTQGMNGGLLFARYLVEQEIGGAK